MDHMKFESPDMVQGNIEKIEALFPNCVTETRGEDGKLKKAVNFELLRQMLSGDVIEGDEAYEFTWVGKKAAIVEANRPIRKTLRPCPEESVNWDRTENLYIEGDNLEVLKLLQESYLGKVKLIYIDPPYNTGNDFIYADDFVLSLNDYEEELGVYDESTGDRLFKNNDSNGRFHSDWCSMIFSRLMLARNLLTDDGTIFISIDDNELDNLKKICDEVFGESNYVNIVTLNLKNTAGASGGGEDKRLKKNCEYILIYAKNYHSVQPFNGPYVFSEISDLIQQYEDEGKSWKYTSILLNAGEKEYIGSTVDGEGNEIKVFRRIGVEIASVNQVALAKGLTVKEVYKQYGISIFQTTNAQSSIRTRIMEYRAEDNIEDDIISIEYTPKTGKNKGQIYEQFYKGDKCRLFVWLKDTSEEINGELYKKDLQGTLWDFVGETKNLTKEGSVPFPNGKKPVKLIRQILKMVTNDQDVVLDFFSGSATTAHAVMLENLSDNKQRKYIMVQLQEKCAPDSDAFKEGFDNICELGKERIRRAGRKIKEESPLTTQNFDTGFRVLKLADSNMTDVYYSAGEYDQSMLKDMESNIKPDRTDLDLLFGCLLEWGLPLSLPYKSEQLDGCTVHTYAPGDPELGIRDGLIACFDANVPESVIESIARRNPLRAVFRESCFTSSPEKINVGETFKRLAQGTTVRVI